MPEDNNVPIASVDSVNSEGRLKLDLRYVGKFILWAVIAIVGWSLYTTEKHETAIAVIQQKIKYIERGIHIDQRLRDI